MDPAAPGSVAPRSLRAESAESAEGSAFARRWLGLNATEGGEMRPMGVVGWSLQEVIYETLKIL
jgi:hypothetical protein